MRQHPITRPEPLWLVLAALAAIGALWLAAGPTRAQARPRLDPVAEHAARAAVNARRVAAGRVRLRAHRALAAAARAQARWLARTGSFSHTGARGRSFAARIIGAGYPRARRMSENIALVEGCGAAAGRRAVALWLKSRAHRANLLDRRVRRIGVGAATLGRCRATVLVADHAR